MSETTQRLTEEAPGTPSARRRSRLPRPDRFDLVLVAGIAVIYAVVLPASTIPPDYLWLVIPCAALLLTVPLIWRTRAPVLTWVLVIALQLTLFLAVPGGDVAAAGITYLSPLVGLGAIAARRPVWVSAFALALTYAFMAMTMVIILARNNPFSDSTAWALTVSGVACTIAWGLGVLAHRHHHRLAQLQREHESTGVAVAAERSRIAAELNSIIKEAIRRMLRDAASARSAIPDDRGRAIAAFTSIEATGVEAMHELRRLLHLLHDEPSLALLNPADSRERPQNRWTSLRRRLASVTRWDVVVTAATIIATVNLAATAFFGPARWPASLYFAVALCVLLWRRTLPVAAFLLVIVADAAAIVVFRNGMFVSDNFTAFPAVLVALAAVAAATPMWISIPALVIAYGYLSLQSFAYPEVLAANLTTVAVLAVAVWLGGMLAGRRRRQIAQLEANGDEARRSVEQERARLAYELHDVIGHSITIMVLQAAGARRIIAHDLDRAVQSLTPIENAGTEALIELDELVRLLTGRPAPVGQTPPLHGLADLDQLVERTRNSVSDITVGVSGQPGRLEPSVDLAAYSVVREALGNAVKHAGLGARIETTVSWSDALVRVEVLNSVDGDEDPPPTDLSGGFGLVHLRERVRIAGGELRWSRDGGVFRVEVVFPVVPSA